MEGVRPKVARPLEVPEAASENVQQSYSPKVRVGCTSTVMRCANALFTM